MRPTDDDDVKYLYASWRLGKFAPEGLSIESETPEAFTETFGAYIAERFQVAYTIIAKAPGKDVMPVGIVFGITPYRDKNVVLADLVYWFPWASPRNKIEGAVHFFNQMRRDWVVLGIFDMSDVPFLDHICRYGVMRRVGTIFDLDKDGPLAAFQTRKPYKGI